MATSGALDKPDVPLITSASKFLINIALDFYNVPCWKIYAKHCNTTYDLIDLRYFIGDSRTIILCTCSRKA